jgi:hypothetical protein
MQRTSLSKTLSWILLAVTLPAVSHAKEPDLLREQATRYEHGLGVERSYAHAYNLYCIAARQGDSAAAYHLGWMHLNGRGMPHSDALAIGWFRLAADRGDAHSRRLLDELLRNGQAEEDSNCPLGKQRPDSTTIDAWVRALAPDYGIDADLVLALIEVESRFNTRARSPKNARGLMQLMPATAKRFGVKDIWDPVQNLLGGLTYLRWLMDRYQENIDLSLAAYNAGEHAVDRYGGIPPYRETRSYVKNIKRLYRDSPRS